MLVLYTQKEVGQGAKPLLTCSTCPVDSRTCTTVLLRTFGYSIFLRRPKPRYSAQDAATVLFLVTITHARFHH